MSTTTQRTHCPNCGAKLPEQPLSLCAYCAMPLELAGDGATQAAGSESPNAPKIAKILERETELTEAMVWSPPEGARYQSGRRAMASGQGLLVAGALLLLVTGLSGGWAGVASKLFGGLGLIAVLAGAVLWLKGRGACQQSLALPLLRRPAYIRDRRSETELVGMGGRTMYYFELEFEGGTVAEFAYAGRGPSEDPYVNGMTGVAYTRGTELLHFRHVRI